MTPTGDEGSRDLETKAGAPVGAAETPRVAIGGGEANDAKANAKEVENPLATAAAAVPETTVASDPIPAPPSSGSTQNLPADKELQGKISDMQQLFEQRKKLTTNPSTPQE